MTIRDLIKVLEKLPEAEKDQILVKTNEHWLVYNDVKGVRRDVYLLKGGSYTFNKPEQGESIKAVELL